MPNWKKVIISGSDAALTSVTATAGFTGSLLGTASYATQALSSSYALTASYALSASYAPPTPPFPFTGSALITGSLGVTGSLSVINSAVNVPAIVARGGGGSGNVISVQTTAGTQIVGIGFTGTTGIIENGNSLPLRLSATNADLIMWNNGTGNLTFTTNGSEKGKIFNNGNFYLGTTPTDFGYKLDVSGSARITGSLNVSAGITGSLLGTSSFASFATIATNASMATSASYALTAATASTIAIANDADIRVITANGNGTLNGEVNLTFNGSLLNVAGNLLVTGSAAIGTSSLGPFENTLTLGARDSGGEGGQLGFNASGGTYTSASFIDLYQNKLRILKGTNATSTGEVANWNMHNLQMALPAYTSPSSFPGTATATLAVDSGGNIITIAGAGGGTVTSVGTSGTVNGITLTGGTITTSGTITLGGALANIQSSQLATSSLMIGTTNIALGATGSTLAGLTSVSATNFTGTASYATQALSASFATTASYVNRLNQAVIVTGSLTVSGSTGTVFSSNVDTLVLTGSLLVTGSTNINGPVTIGISNITTNTIASSAAGANLVFNQATGSYTAAKYLYTVSNGANARAGEVVAVWNGTTTQYTDYSTLDIGATTAVTASVSIVTAQAQFNVQTATSGWKIKSYVTYL